MLNTLQSLIDEHVAVHFSNFPRLPRIVFVFSADICKHLHLVRKRALSIIYMHHTVTC